MPHLLRTFYTSLLAFAFAFTSFSAVAQSPTGTFTISAGDVSITQTGSGTIPFTLASVNGFAGSIVIGCQPPNVAAGVNIPFCGGGPVRVYTLTADQAITGTITLFAYGSPMPAGFGPVSHPLVAFLLVVALLAGLTFRRRSARWLTLPLLLVMLIPLSSTLGCVSRPRGFTPGTYGYTITATQYGLVTPLQKATTVTLTIR